MTTFCLILKHLVINRPCVPYPNYCQLFVSVSVKYFVIFFFNVLTCILTHSVLFGCLYWRMSKTFFLGNMHARQRQTQIFFPKGGTKDNTVCRKVDSINIFVNFTTWILISLNFSGGGEGPTVLLSLEPRK